MLSGFEDGACAEKFWLCERGIQGLGVGLNPAQTPNPDL